MSRRMIEGFGPYSTEPNPCVRLWGPGPEGAKCKTCSLLLAKHHGAHTYYKCHLRRMTAGPATDHRVGWKACAKYMEAE